MPAPRFEAARILGERVRQIRLDRGLSQEDVASLAEIHVTNLGKIERGLVNPSLVTLVRIAGVMDADPGSLITGMTLQQIPALSHQLTAADLIRERKARELGETPNGPDAA